MVFLIHLLEHSGLPSGAAIAVVIAGQKLLKGGTSKIGAHRDRETASTGQGHPHDDR